MTDSITTSGLPELRAQTLWSYGGTSQVTHVCAPCDRLQLSAALRYASAHGRKVTFRAGGRSFDTQSLNDVLVISLEHFGGIRVDEATATVIVGASARWGDILSAVTEKGLVPHAMATSSQATAAGTLSADCLSRFSPTHGKEGHHVLWFDFMKLDGEVIRCSRSQHPEVFRAVIAGLGYLGVILEVCYQLMQLPYEAPNIAIETEFEPFTGIDDLADRLLPKLELVQNPDEPWGAISAALYMNRKRQGLIMTSKYVNATPAERKGRGTVLHQPYSIGHLALQLLALFELPRILGFLYTFNFAFKTNRRRIDELRGYTFFQDGNDTTKRWGRALGLPMGVRQQTFLVPWDPSDKPGSKLRLRNFLNDIDALLDARGLLPTLIDVLYLPDDTQDGFLLSSSHGMSGFAISIAFEKVISAKFPHEEQAFRDLAQICRTRYGGRVHLVKHVYAAKELLREMYPALPTFLQRKRELDRDCVLHNEFLDRVFPEAAQPDASGG